MSRASPRAPTRLGSAGRTSRTRRRGASSGCRATPLARRCASLTCTGAKARCSRRIGSSSTCCTTSSAEASTCSHAWWSCSSSETEGALEKRGTVVDLASLLARSRQGDCFFSACTGHCVQQTGAAQHYEEFSWKPIKSACVETVIPQLALGQQRNCQHEN